MADPAVQRTADRETIARALWDHWWRGDKTGIGDRRWDDPEYRRMRWLREAEADAVLAVLVPADLIRAEAWDEGVRAAQHAQPYSAPAPGSNPYRKAAGA